MSMVLYYQWLQLPLATRAKIAQEFGFIKKGPTEVFSNTIKSDGYLIKDIDEAITLNGLQKYLGTTETDFTILWNYLIDKIEGRNIVLIDKVEAVPQPIAVDAPKPRGRPKKI